MEHTLVLLKPSVLIGELHTMLLREFVANGLSVMRTERIRLSVEQVETSFTSLYNIEEYKKFMTSDYVEVFLVKGEFAVTKVKEIKNNIRLRYNVNRYDLCNLIHSADEGLEYYLQFKCCFPNEDICKFCGFADALIKHEDNLYFSLYNKNGNVIKYYGNNRRFIYDGYIVNIIGYRKNKEDCFDSNLKRYVYNIKKGGGFATLGIMPIKSYTDEMFRVMSSIGIDAAIAFDTSFTLEESKTLQDFLEKYNIVPLGGSNGNTNYFEITICQSTYHRLTDKINAVK